MPPRPGSRPPRWRTSSRSSRIWTRASGASTGPREDGRRTSTRTSFGRSSIAAREETVVAADYYTASRGALTAGRRLAPLGFLVRAGAWLVAAVDLDAPGRPVKDFALAGFRAVEACPGEHASPPAGFSLDGHARDRWGALDGPVEEIRLLVESEAVPYFERKLYME